MSFPYPVKTFSGCMYSPFTRYLLVEQEAQGVMQASKYDPLITCSGVQSYERRYHGHDANGKTICVVRHMGIGDCLVITSVVKYIKDLYPQALIDVYTAPHQSADVWIDNPSLRYARHINSPLTLEAMKQYNYHLFFDGMFEMNTERDQRCCYDDIFQFCGFYDVPDEKKRPVLYDSAMDSKYVDNSGVDLSKPYYVVVYSSSNPVRDYPDSKTLDICSILAKTHNVYLVGAAREKPAIQIDGVINLVNETRHWRHLIPVIKSAKCVVTPDTGLMHVAACYDVPTVSLWGSFSWASRAKYYKNNHPLGNHDICKHSPCWHHGFGCPIKKCKSVNQSVDNKNCWVLDGITPEEIASKVMEIA